MSAAQFLFLPLAGVLPVQPAVPVGPEFHVNSTVNGPQTLPEVAGTPDGGFIVVWQSSGQLPGSAVFARRFRANGQPISADFLVNSSTTQGHLHPAVSVDGYGSFVVVWHSSSGKVYGRRYDVAGTAQGDEFRISESPAGGYVELRPQLAHFADGGFVVVWEGAYPSGIFGRRFDANGAAQGSSFEVHQAIVPFQNNAEVAIAGSGEFVVVWDRGEDYQSFGGSGQIYGRRFDSQGVPIADEFKVNSIGLENNVKPEVSATAVGEWVVSWHGEQPVYLAKKFARHLAGDGTPVGPEIVVGDSNETLRTLSLGTGPDDRFEVVWYKEGDGSEAGIFGRSLLLDGTPIGEEFQVNTFTTDRQMHPHLVVDAEGDFVVVWQSLGQTFDGGWGIFGQRFLVNQIFVDAFESGDTSAWSSSVP